MGREPIFGGLLKVSEIVFLKKNFVSTLALFAGKKNAAVGNLKQQTNFIHSDQSHSTTRVIHLLVASKCIVNNVHSYASFRTSLTITPIPSKISCKGALHMKAQVVTILLAVST